MIKDKNIDIINSSEKLSKEEINKLKNKIIIYKNELAKLKTDIKNLNNETSNLNNINIKLENKLVSNNIEKKQMEIVDYYLRK